MPETADPLGSEGLVEVSSIETFLAVLKNKAILSDVLDVLETVREDKILGLSEEPCTSGPIGGLPEPGRAPPCLPGIRT